MKSLRGIRAILFDLDNTLYSIDSGLQQSMYLRGVSFTSTKLKIDISDGERLIKKLIKQYGTIEYGLIREFNIDPEEYIKYVFSVPIEKHLDKNQKLKELLLEINTKKAIFSDSPKEHIIKVLNYLEIGQFFEKVYDKRFYSYHSKSNPKVHEAVLQDLNLTGNQCLLIDDSLSNLNTGKHMGMITVWVTAECKENKKFIDYTISNILELSEIIKNSKDISVTSGMRAITLDC